ncbi:MAG TPA: MaoC family dehydratase [Macromonas sp.]|nr:MaoC family dehydratase [Macromonas sp.]
MNPTMHDPAPAVAPYHLGQRFVTASHTVQAADILAFAQQYDPQPQHLDEVAATARFGGLIASGWHTAALTMRLLVSSGLFRQAGESVGAGADVRWLRPVRAGDVLTAHAEVTAITPSRHRAGQCTVVMTVQTLNQRQEVVQTMAAKLVTSG